MISRVTWLKRDCFKWLILSIILIVKCFFLQVNWGELGWLWSLHFKDVMTENSAIPFPCIATLSIPCIKCFCWSCFTDILKVISRYSVYLRAYLPNPNYSMHRHILSFSPPFLKIANSLHRKHDRGDQTICCAQSSLSHFPFVAWVRVKSQKAATCAVNFTFLQYVSFRHIFWPSLGNIP